MRTRGPALLFAAWALHDVEEALAFPATADRLAMRLNTPQLRLTPAQSWTAVGLMGVLVGSACAFGARTDGRSAFYRAVVAGLEAHVATHLAASAVQRGYTAGVATAVPVMLPGALAARRELARAGHRLTPRDTARGAAILLPAALACHGAARWICRSRA